jgi:hypothetical protein
MPKKLIQTIYSGYDELMNYEEEAATDGQSQELAPAAVDAAGAPPPPAPMEAPMAAPVEPPLEGGPV